MLRITFTHKIQRMFSLSAAVTINTIFLKYRMT